MEQNVVAFSKAKTKKRSTDLFVRELTPCPRDIDAYWKIAFGENLHRFVSFLEARSPSEAERRITEAFKNRYETMYGLFKKNRLIGVFSVNDGAINGQKIAEMHYFIAEKFQRRGYCTEGIRLLSVMLSDTYDFFIFSKPHFGHPFLCKNASGVCQNSPCFGHIIHTLTWHPLYSTFE